MSIMTNNMNKIKFQNLFFLFLALLTTFFFYTGCKRDYKIIKAEKSEVYQVSEKNKQEITKTDSTANPHTTAPERIYSDWDRSYHLGKTFMSQEKYLEALAHLKTALDEVDNSVNNRYKVYFGLGECYEKLGNDKRAFMAFYTASNIKPDSKEALKAVRRLRRTAQLK